MEQVQQAQELTLVAYDEDLTSSDLLGTAVKLSYVSLVEDREVKFFDVDLYQDYKKTGTVKFTTQFIWREPDPPAHPLLAPDSKLYVTIVQASFLKDSDMFGKQDPYITFKFGDKLLKTDV